MSNGLGSREYAAIFLALGAVALLMAAGFRTQDLLLAGLTLGLYGLHLVSMRSIRDRQERQSAFLREVGAALDDLSTPPRDGETASVPGPASPSTGGSPASSSSPTPGATGATGGGGRGEVPEKERPGADGEEASRGGGEKVRRNLQIGTVAMVEGILEPSQVSQVMSIKEQKPQRAFGEIAVDMGLLDPDQVEELREIKRNGVYSKRKLTNARAELRAFLGKGAD